MHAIRELASVVAAAILAFFGGIMVAFGFVVLWVCGIASGLCLMVAIVSGVMCGITGKLHDGRIALTFLGYAVVPFVFTFIAGYYRSKATRVLNLD